MPPVPHVLEHALHAPNELAMQSMGHGLMLHTTDSDRAGHSLPPSQFASSTLRDRLRQPLPQVTGQALQLLQDCTVQSTGQWRVLQERVADSSGHGLPENAAGRITMRLRVCEPVPQVSEHKDQLAQPVTTQPTGSGVGAGVIVGVGTGVGASVRHALVLQSRSWACGHPTPLPWLCLITTGRSCCVPVPQLFEHCDQSVQPS